MKICCNSELTEVSYDPKSARIGSILRTLTLARLLPSWVASWTVWAHLYIAVCDYYVHVECQDFTIKQLSVQCFLLFTPIHTSLHPFTPIHTCSHLLTLIHLHCSVWLLRTRRVSGFHNKATECTRFPPFHTHSHLFTPINTSPLTFQYVTTTYTWSVRISL